jgi:small subunit ribosomal protein S13
MARIAGVEIPQNKRIEAALPYIYGVGLPLSKKILAATKIDPNKRTKDLTDEEIAKLKEEIEGKYKIEGELKRETLMHIKRLREIGSYRGSRHAKHLPVRGQRTKTNSRTVRGNVRKTAGSGRKAANEKT